jgi:hypothetical protein
MANERDQAIVRSAVSDAAANLLAFVPSLGTREVLAFGEGVALPTRLKFKQLPEKPHSAEPGGDQCGDRRVDPMTEDFIDTIIDRWRGATMSKQTRSMAARISKRWCATSSRASRPRRRRSSRRRRPSSPRRPRLDPDSLPPVEEAAGRPSTSAHRRSRRPAAARLRRPSAGTKENCVGLAQALPKWRFTL